MPHPISDTKYYILHQTLKPISSTVSPKALNPTSKRLNPIPSSTAKSRLWRKGRRWGLVWGFIAFGFMSSEFNASGYRLLLYGLKMHQTQTLEAYSSGHMIRTNGQALGVGVSVTSLRCSGCHLFVHLRNRRARSVIAACTPWKILEHWWWNLTRQTNLFRKRGLSCTVFMPFSGGRLHVCASGSVGVCQLYYSGPRMHVGLRRLRMSATHEHTFSSDTPVVTGGLMWYLGCCCPSGASGRTPHSLNFTATYYRGLNNYLYCFTGSLLWT